MSAHIIWGSIFVFLGLSLILKSIFNIALPLVRPIIGGIFIYLGLHIMMDPFGESVTKETLIFGHSQQIARQEVRSYNAIGSCQQLDFSSISDLPADEVTINVLCGNETIIIDPHTPVYIQVNALASRVVLPNETMVSFGRNLYKTVGQKEALLRLHVNAVCANVEIKHDSQRQITVDVEQELQKDAGNT